ncbi:hypothetical protein Q8A73_013383 [Channa argus]|nr:hypothetical protein Q8A73_013383 [Channa argus]
MSRKALKVVVEVKFRAVSCPGVHLSAKDDIYLSMYFMDQYRHSEHLPAVFPLLFYEKMTFEKAELPATLHHSTHFPRLLVSLALSSGSSPSFPQLPLPLPRGTPGYETARIELVQMIPPLGDTLACFEEDARRFLFPEPKLVPSFSGVDQQVLMTRAPHFPGIAPMLEFSTKTTITECSADAEVNIYPNVPMANDKEKQEVLQQTQDPLSSEETTSNPRKKKGWQDGHGQTKHCKVTVKNSQIPVLVSTESYAGFMAWSQSICTVYHLTFDQVFIHSEVLSSWQNKIFIEWFGKNYVFFIHGQEVKQMIPWTIIRALNPQGCGGLIENKPGIAVLTENGKKSMSVFGDSSRHQKLYADLFTGPQPLK